MSEQHLVGGFQEPELEYIYKSKRIEMESELAALRARVAELEKALRVYGTHRKTCPVVGGYEYPCGCGLDAALARKEPDHD